MRVVVFVLRGCPAGWLGAYGNEWVATPNLDRLAAEGVVFDRHVSDRPDPDAATAAWLGRGTLTDALRAANVRTVLVRANQPDTDGVDWFYAAWDEVFDARPLEEDKSPLDALIRSLPTLLDRLETIPNYLLWIEIDRLIPPWDVPQDVFDAYRDENEADEPTEGRDDEDETEFEEPDAEVPEQAGEGVDAEEPDSDEPEEEAAAPQPTPAIPPWSDPPTGPFDNADTDAWEWLHSTFAAVVTTLDAELGVLFEQLRARGLAGSAAWVVTSDFGYPLGEHGQIGRHRPWLHQEFVHLPLILRLPGAAQACRRVPGFTQPPNLPPTLLELFGVTPAAGFSLLPLARGDGEAPQTHAVTVLELSGAAEAAIRTDEWAFLLPLTVPDGEARQPQLYEKPDDRWEVNDLRPRNVERADGLEAELRTALGSPG